MKIGCFSVLFSKKSRAEALDIIVKIGCNAVELGVGSWPGDAHCNLDALLKSATERQKLQKEVTDRDLIISALSCHGNPLHPDKDFAQKEIDTQHKTIQLAQELGVPVVNTFSGCPGGAEGDSTPNWVTCAWPPDFEKILKWQWEEKLIPFWKKEADILDNAGVKIGLEMHPGFCVYNARTMLNLRKPCGKAIGANFDPSHLFWQGMNPIAVVRDLKDAIHHVHAKDMKLYPPSKVNGVLDTVPYNKEGERSWIFRTVGYGHGLLWWKDFVSALRMVGYDYVLSIEHEDSLMSISEGLTRAMEILKQAVMMEKPGEMFWA